MTLTSNLSLKGSIFSKRNPRIIAWGGLEQMHISWFLWCSCTGEKLRELHWALVSCRTSAFHPLSHELIKSWWDGVAGAAFEMLFSHAQDWQQQLMTVSVLSHAQGVLPPGATVISPGQLLRVQGDELAAAALLSSWTLSGSWGKHGATWKYPISVGCQLEHYEQRLISPHKHRQNKAILPSVENSRTIILLFPNKEISQRILVLANFCHTLLVNCFCLLIKFVCQDLPRELYLRALLLTANVCGTFFS